MRTSSLILLFVFCFWISWKNNTLAGVRFLQEVFERCDHGFISIPILIYVQYFQYIYFFSVAFSELASICHWTLRKLDNIAEHVKFPCWSRPIFSLVSILILPLSIMASSEKKHQSPVAVVGANVAIGLIKAMMFTYDIATLPIYTVVQRPWIVWKNRLVSF